MYSTLTCTKRFLASAGEWERHGRQVTLKTYFKTTKRGSCFLNRMNQIHNTNIEIEIVIPTVLLQQSFSLLIVFPRGLSDCQLGIQICVVLGLHIWRCFIKVFIPEENLSHANADIRSPVGKVNPFWKRGAPY